MGAAMCGQLIKGGFSATVYNRTASKAQGLVDAGAVLASSPGEVARNSDVVFTIVGFPSDVRSVILGDDGILANLKPGGIVVDMTTSEPALAQEIAKAAAGKNCAALDCPVSGGDIGAKKGTLTIFAGGDEPAVEAVAPLLECMGKINKLGGPGAGQHCKMANQIGIANTMLGMCEGMLYAHKAGLDVPLYVEAIRNGGAGSKSIDLYSARIFADDMEPGFFVKHFVKDLGIALDECRGMGIALPGLAVAQQLYVSLASFGEENLGTQALIKVLERMNNTKIPR
jgi:3-hydroxyisobutyrate dehydrogenase-like beta-hydroxyacid dehydrogenase